MLCSVTSAPLLNDGIWLRRTLYLIVQRCLAWSMNTDKCLRQMTNISPFNTCTVTPNWSLPRGTSTIFFGWALPCQATVVSHPSGRNEAKTQFAPHLLHFACSHLGVGFPHSCKDEGVGPPPRKCKCRCLGSYLAKDSHLANIS